MNGINKDDLRIDFECAVIDGINIYCREVLMPNEMLDKSKYTDDLEVMEKLCQEKYCIAREIALKFISYISDK